MKALLSQGRARAEIFLKRQTAQRLPVYVSLATAEVSNTSCICLLVKDITSRKQLEQTGANTTAWPPWASPRPCLPTRWVIRLTQSQRPCRCYSGTSTSKTTVRQLHLIELQREIQRLTTLLQDFRSLSRPQKLDLARIDLARLVEDVLTIQAAEFSEFHVEVKKEFPAALEVTIDEERIKQVLLNLFKNSVEAMPTGGTLTLRGYASGENICLEITDTGVGVPKGVDIFELFTTTKPMGTGVGLAVARQMISAHGGTITYVSEPNQGTTFFLLFPANLAAAGQR